MTRYIKIKNAFHHNLKSIDIHIPKENLVVICGPSGSGKSTLAFDIIYAEGQRRYVESLSAYARQFLPQMEKPKVEKIEGISPAIAIEQRNILKNPRSTVGTVTEIYDYLRVFFARLGKIFCPKCNLEVKSQSVDEIIEEIYRLDPNTKFLLLAPIVEHKKGQFSDLFKKLLSQGFIRVLVDGEIHMLDNPPLLDKNKKHNIFVVVDRLILKEGIRKRLSDSLELALRLGAGHVLIKIVGGEDLFFSTEAVCPRCKINFPKLTPQLFSFNSPQGACPMCYGIGSIETFDIDLMVPNKGLSIEQGAILPLGKKKAFKKFFPYIQKILNKYGYDVSTPFKDLSSDLIHELFYGNADIGWKGIINVLEENAKFIDGKYYEYEFSRYKQKKVCPNCNGSRLKKESLSVKIEGATIFDVCTWSIRKVLKWLRDINLEGVEREIGEPLIKEMRSRLEFLSRVGLEYLSLSREMSTLSGGEAQRIRLAGQLGSGLEGICYVLDEPSIGLHPKDNKRLLDALIELKLRGNTVLVVEHDEETIRSADHIIELGPGSGMFGGEIVYSGDVEGLLKADTLTGKYLRGELKIDVIKKRKKAKEFLVLKGVRTNNLKNIDIEIPLGVMVCVTGVSGSGKSSLVTDTLYKHLALQKGYRVENPGIIDGIYGFENIENVIFIDQSPIGRTPRSNPATYTKIFDLIREIFASTKEARQRGYKPGRFSFNVRGGRCERCEGEGYIKIQMHFLPDVYVKCEVCKGKRYNKETLDIHYKGLNIADVLDLTVRQAKNVFENHQALLRKLEILEAVGLEYIKLGQPATTLSGGEAQRIKISRELSKRNLPGNLYILDEPTTGLHMHEVGKLIYVLKSLVEKGASVIVIEHNPYVINSADYVFDLGPGGGEFGGEIIAKGTPEEIKANPMSITGPYI